MLASRSDLRAGTKLLRGLNGNVTVEKFRYPIVQIFFGVLHFIKLLGRSKLTATKELK